MRFVQLWGAEHLSTGKQPSTFDKSECLHLLGQAVRNDPKNNAL
jgi:hypothetical protein